MDIYIEIPLIMKISSKEMRTSSQITDIRKKDMFMNIKKLRNTILAGAALLLSPLVPLQAATTADILFVVDESGSMSGEHTWIGNMVTHWARQVSLVTDLV